MLVGNLGQYSRALVGFGIFISAAAISNSVVAEPVLTLKEAEQIAQQRDPVIRSYAQQAAAAEEMSVVMAQLPDPQIQLGVVNFPTDTFDRDQENMTQLKFGVVQKFPSFARLKIKGEQGTTRAKQQYLMAEDQRRMLLKNVRVTWLERLYWLEARQLVLQNQQVFEQLVSVSRSMYETGRNNQYDVLRAELELENLSDRLFKIENKLESTQARLEQWLGKDARMVPDSGLPNWMGAWQSELINKQMQGALINHPKVKLQEEQVNFANQTVDIAKTEYSPDWALNVSYGQRDDTQAGVDRSDLFSAVVTFNVPVFTEQRQDKKLAASHYDLAAAKDKRLAVLWQLQAELQGEQANSIRLADRHSLFDRKILPQSREHAKAALLAYQSDATDFDQVVRATVMKLDAELNYQRIIIDHLQSLAKLRYFSVGEMEANGLSTRHENRNSSGDSFIAANSIVRTVGSESDE